jgi:hypothetical protein
LLLPVLFHPPATVRDPSRAGTPTGTSLPAVFYTADQNCRGRLRPVELLCLSHSLLSHLKIQVPLTSHISEENNYGGKTHGKAIHINLLNSFLAIFHTSVTVTFSHLIYKSAVTKPVFFFFFFANFIKC